MIRLEMTKKQEMILAALIIVAALAAFVLYSGILSRPEPEEPPPPTLFEIVTAQSDEMYALDAEYRNWFSDGEYSFEDPLVILNPYGTSPLTALVIFETEELTRISIRINGKTEDTSIYHTFDGFDTLHEIPIYGLYPGAANVVDIIAEPEDSLPGVMLPRTQILIETPAVDWYFHGNLITQVPDAAALTEQTQEQPEFTFTHMMLCAFDENGDYRWHYQGYETIYPTSYTDDGNILLIIGSFEEGNALLIELDKLGKVIDFSPIGPDYEFDDHHGRHHVEKLTFYR